MNLAEIHQGFRELGVLGKPVVFHTSFRSFGKVEGGLDAYIQFLRAHFETILVPAFTWDSTIHPPENDRPLQNGMDYSVPWKSPAKPFRVADALIDSRMGIVPQKIASLPGACRSAHPWHSWAAWGKGAQELVQPHPWDVSNLPLERLSAQGGWGVLIGVSLKYCTALHVAEERSGRRPFVRWALDEHGVAGRIRVGGCANWFEAMQPRLQHLIASRRIGQALVQVMPLEPLIETAARLIREEPQLAFCAPSCIKCRDALKGGPLAESSLSC